MEVLKYYIDFKTYSSLIRVSKNMYIRVKDMEGRTYGVKLYGV